MRRLPVLLILGAFAPLSVVPVQAQTPQGLMLEQQTRQDCLAYGETNRRRLAATPNIGPNAARDAGDEMAFRCYVSTMQTVRAVEDMIALGQRPASKVEACARATARRQPSQVPPIIDTLMCVQSSG